jgi:hypothetical protein
LLQENIAILTSVIVRYKGKPYPGKVMEVKDDGAVLKCMDPCGRSKWKWPSPDDILDYRDQDILCVINPPHLSKCSNVRAISYEVPEIDDLDI